MKFATGGEAHSISIPLSLSLSVSGLKLNSFSPLFFAQSLAQSLGQSLITILPSSTATTEIVVVVVVASPFDTLNG